MHDSYVTCHKIILQLIYNYFLLYLIIFHEQYFVLVRKLFINKIE